MLNDVIEITRRAGDAIMALYDETHTPDLKADQSPVTAADHAAHHVIAEGLAALDPVFPLLSEEGADIAYAERRAWSSFWCVDPLDGTKEFLKKTGSFTVNIALIRDRQPVLGVIYAPAIDQWYYAEAGQGAFARTGNQPPRRLQVRPFDTDHVAVVASRDHAGPGVKRLLSKLENPSMKSMGSSLKFCLVAAGEADVYYRDVPTFEWDTAAAQSIVSEAGGVVLTEEGHPLLYNKENLRNPGLLTCGNQPAFWLECIQ
jgi:3'(2'), 5'-bisphosphate nucleotidase